MDLKELSASRETFARHPWETSRFNIVRRLIDPVIKERKNCVLVDVGCGDTFFIHEMSQNLNNPNNSYFAFDPLLSDEHIQSFENKSNHKIVITNKVEYMNQLTVKADFIFLMDVLEHIEKDREFLNDLMTKNYVGVNTIFVITVPAYQSLFCSHDTFLLHFRRYTNKSLLQLIQGAGLGAIQLGYFYFSLLPVRLVQIAKEKMSKQKLFEDNTNLGQWNKGKTFTQIVSTFLYLDFLLGRALSKIGIKLPGLSNYILCKKADSTTN